MSSHSAAMQGLTKEELDMISSIPDLVTDKVDESNFLRRSGRTVKQRAAPIVETASERDPTSDAPVTRKSSRKAVGKKITAANSTGRKAHQEENAVSDALLTTLNTDDVDMEGSGEIDGAHDANFVPDHPLSDNAASGQIILTPLADKPPVSPPSSDDALPSSKKRKFVDTGSDNDSSRKRSTPVKATPFKAKPTRNKELKPRDRRPLSHGTPLVWAEVIPIVDIL